MRHYTDHLHSAVLLLAFCSVVVAIMTVPTRHNTAYTAIGDRNFVQARAILESLYRQGDDDPHIGIALHDMHLRFGNIEKAKIVLISTMNKHTDNVELLVLAERFFKDIQDPNNRIEVLQRIMDKRPSADTLDKIRALLGLFNKQNGEEEILLRYARSHFLNHEHHARLGLIHARRKKFEEAVFHLTRADIMQPDANWQVRTVLFNILTSNGSFDDARALATRWLNGPAGKDQISFLAHELLTGGRQDLAVELLTTAVASKRITDAQARQILTNLKVI